MSAGYHATGYHATGYYWTGLYGGPPVFQSLLSRTYYSLIWEARDQLKDPDPQGYRYPDEMLLNALNRGLNELSRIRPDAYYELFETNAFQVPEIDEVNWTDPFALDLRFYDPLLHYVVGNAELSEDDYANSGWGQRTVERFRKHALRV